MRERMRELEDNMQNTRTELQTMETKLQSQITSLEHRVTDLTLSSEGDRKFRRQGYKKISEGHKAAYHGDAVADASLYTSGRRVDEGILTELYGLTANQISYLGKC